MRYILISLLTLLVVVVKANNIHVTDPVIVDPLEDETKIGIRVSWENSWRCELGHAPNNWDAAWIFVKYKRSDKGDWQHASIKSTIAGDDSEHKVPDDKLGVMVYRKAAGYGSFSDTLTIVWDRVKDIEAAKRPVIASEICVYAIEMVQIPEGTFYLGDGSDGTQYGVWSSGTLSPIQPYKVQSEGPIVISNHSSISSYALYYRGVGRVAYTYGNSVPESYPKGFDEFYCMKTEISQGQYCAFLNKLNPMQISSDNQEKNFSPVSLEFGDEDQIAQYGNTIKKNDHGIYEVGDPYRACNFLTSLKVLSYLSWAALRPMTEMEYEKACRGPITPRPGEFAWGRPAPTNKKATAFLHSDDYETYTMGSATDSANYYISPILRPGTSGSPGRVGAFAQANTNRVQAGATYFGVLDMSGGLAELVIPLNEHDASSSMNWAFTRIHGNGLPLKDNTGTASWPSTWPKITAKAHVNGYAHRGGHFMCKPASGSVDAYKNDPSTGMISSLGVMGGNGSGSLTVSYYGYTYDYSYGSYSGIDAFYLHGYGGRGVRSF